MGNTKSRAAVANNGDTGVNPRAPHLATAAVVATDGDEEVRKLYAAFHDYNARFFGGKLAAPLIWLTNAKSARTAGDYIAKDAHGLQSRIRIAPSSIKRGELWYLDTLLHEMVHAWQHEVDGDLERGYRGHGPRFAAKCTEIGAQLGLPPVGVKGRDGKPDCKHWPNRPEGYYPPLPEKPGKAPASAPEGSDGEGDSGAAEGPVRPPKGAVANLARQLRKLDTDSLRELLAELEEELSERE